MKFLCDNCKAKYQIADEKVAGKTVRMKCRKCGHQIEVRAAVTETSVSTAPPGMFDEAPKPAPKSPLATSLSAQKPRAPQPSQGGALAGAFQRTVQEDAAQASSDPSALQLSVTDEWYVAINGVPVGPVRISELRRKAGAGTVTEDSLCWQEGLEEWRPVRSIPELAAIVREAAQNNRASAVAPPPSPPAEPRGALPPRTPQRTAPEAPKHEAPRAVSTAVMAPARSNVVPLHARGATAEKLDEVPGPFGVSAAAFAPAVAPSPNAATELAPLPAPEPAPPPPAALSAVADPFALPAPGIAADIANAPAALAAPMAAPHPAHPADVGPRRGGVPLWFWPILVLVPAFGVTAAWFIFGKQPPPQQIIVQVPVPASATAPTATAAQDVPPPAPSAEPVASASASASARPVVAAAGGTQKATTTTAAAPTATEKKTADLSGLLPGVGGPSAGPAGGPGAGGGGGLDSASVQRVVRDRQAGVKRSCWERGGGEQKSSANVTVAVNVAANGSVSGASASGDDPVVAKCIENQVRTWSFPAPGSPTTVNIPFHFVRQ